MFINVIILQTQDCPSVRVRSKISGERNFTTFETMMVLATSCL